MKMPHEKLRPIAFVVGVLLILFSVTSNGQFTSKPSLKLPNASVWTRVKVANTNPVVYPNRGWRVINDTNLWEVQKKIRDQLEKACLSVHNGIRILPR